MFDIKDYQLVSPAGHTFFTSATFTRPADVTAYTANDVVAPASGQLNIIPVGTYQLGHGGYLTSAAIITNKLALTPRLRLWFFGNGSPTNGPTDPGGGAVPIDNAAYAGPMFADASYFYVDLAAMVSGGDCSYSFSDTIRKPVFSGPIPGCILMLVQTLDAFTPNSGQQFIAKLTMERG